MPDRTRYRTLALEAANGEDLQALAGFAEFWKIPYITDSTPGSNSATIASGRIPQSTEPTSPIILSPSSDASARKICDRFGLQVSMTESLVRLPFSRTSETSIRTKIYEFKSSRLKPVIESEGTPLLSRLDSSSFYFLSVDLASDFTRQVSNGIEDPPSFKFKMATRLPFSYRMIPSFVRNRAFRKDSTSDPAGENVGPVECLRTIFLASLLTVTNSPFPIIGFWSKGKHFGAAISHDVETGRGLDEGTKVLLGVEDQLHVRSTWNIVTNRYPLTAETLQSLASSGEIGAHDTDHDGRLIFLPLSSMTSRLRNCRETLERIACAKVRGFRAPLLQHDRNLIEAVGKAGYSCDSSVPSWELLSPTSLKSHGIGSIFPLSLEGVNEIPVSLSQDHQLLRVRGLTPSEARTSLEREVEWISRVGGICTLLVHPDYDFAEDGEEYSRIVKRFSEDPSCQVMTLGDASDWWSHRQNARVALLGDEVKLISGEGERVNGLHIQIAKSFDKNGFSIEEAN